MVIALAQVAETLQAAPEDLRRQSPDAYMLREKRLAELDSADVQDRYGVSATVELRHKIAGGGIFSDPAWADPIEWEHLPAHMQRLDSLRPQTGPG